MPLPPLQGVTVEYSTAHRLQQGVSSCSEALGDLIATPPGARRQVRGQLDELCAPGFFSCSSEKFATRPFAGRKAPMSLRRANYRDYRNQKRRTTRSVGHELGVVLPGAGSAPLRPPTRLPLLRFRERPARASRVVPRGPRRRWHSRQKPPWGMPCAPPSDGRAEWQSKAP